MEKERKKNYFGLSHKANKTYTKKRIHINIIKFELDIIDIIARNNTEEQNVFESRCFSASITKYNGQKLLKLYNIHQNRLERCKKHQKVKVRTIFYQNSEKIYQSI